MRLFKKPVLCNYYLTYRCNAKCGFCDIWEKPSPYVSLENVTENLTALKKMGVKVVDFTGGEPLLHKQLPEFLSLAKKLGFITTVTTNTLLYPKFASKLVGLIDMLHFSLDSAYKDEHNASRGVSCFDHLLKSIDIAKELGEKPDILFTVTDQNVHEIPVVYETISQKHNLMLILNPVFSYSDVGENLSLEALQALKKWGRKKQVYLNEAFIDLRIAGGNQIEDPVCKAGSATVVISPHNELVLPCYHLSVKSFPIQGNLAALFHSQEVKKEIEKAGKMEACQGCTINCYMEPSFAVELNKYFLKSIASTLKYSIEKWIA